MFVTNLIKNPAFNKLIVSNFPKPLISASKKSSVENNNLNPSLTGSSFEVFFRVTHAKSKLSFKKAFEKDFQFARQNINEISDRSISIQKYNVQYLAAKKYRAKVRLLKKLIADKSLIKTNSFYQLKYIEIKPALELMIYDLKKYNQANQMGIYLPCNSLNSILINIDVLKEFYFNVIENFELLCIEFIQSRKISKKLVEYILLFSHVSSPFYKLGLPIMSSKPDEKYIGFVQNLFRKFSNSFKLIKSPLVYKPKLHSFDILATPDFLCNNTLLEIKTSKRFFSLKDYLQSFTYLIFAQEKKNKILFGEINSVIIYYPLYCQSVKIDIGNNMFTKKFIAQVRLQIEKYKADRFRF